MYAADQTGYQRRLRRPAGRWRHRDQHACRRSSRATRRSTCTTAAPTTTGDLDQGQGRARNLRPARPASAPTSPTAPTGRRSRPTAEALQQSLAQVGIKLTLKRLSRPVTTSPAVRRQAGLRQRRTASASRSTAGAPTGPTASASCSRSPTAGSSAPRAVTSNLGVNIPKIDSLIDKALDRDRRRRPASDLGRRSTRQVMDTRDRCCRASGPRHCCYRAART